MGVSAPAVRNKRWQSIIISIIDTCSNNTHMYIMTYNNVCTHGRGRGLHGPVDIGWCACDKTNTINHVHAHLVGFGVVCRMSVHYAQCFGHYRNWGVGSTATT